MRSQLIRNRLRSNSLSAVPPPQASEEYSFQLADTAARIVYRSPLPSPNDLPLFIINAAALPDAKEADYDALLPYVLTRLPDEEELLGGRGYEVVFFAGGEDGGSTSAKKDKPRWGWLLQAYNILTRAMRKRLQKLYIVHERTWIRIIAGMFSRIVSPKFRKKVVHANSLGALATHIPIEDLLIPLSAYLYDRRNSQDIQVPYAHGKRAFGVKVPLPTSSSGLPRLPRVLREATSFLVMEQNIKTKGIFRINAKAVTVDILRDAYKRGQKFIVWKEGDAVLTFSHWIEGTGEVMIKEIDTAEGFGLQSAAGLIKRWYAELHEPIFPESSYSHLEASCGDFNLPISAELLHALIGIDTEWSPISRTSRLIVNMHLLPLLSKVVQYQDWNQMTAYNLAVCFAPCLIRGMDAIEDARAASITTRLLEAAIKNWSSHLSTLHGVDDELFEESLRAPEAIADREDELEESNSSPTSPTRSSQIEGIVMVDYETDEELETKPPLPPRPEGTASQSRDTDIATKRKPAPSVQAPPRYSTINNRDSIATQLPAYEVVNESAEHLDNLTLGT